MYDKFLDWFKLLPLAAIVDNKYFCVHGGISPDFVSLSNIISIKKINSKESVEILKFLKKDYFVIYSGVIPQMMMIKIGNKIQFEESLTFIVAV